LLADLKAVPGTIGVRVLYDPGGSPARLACSPEER
jgi:hypothetical protein